MRNLLCTTLLVLAASTGCAHAQGDGPSPTRVPGASRIVAMADLHGDIEAARRALRLAGAIDMADRWIGGSLVVVQTGDQLDRGGDERAILHLFDRLAAEARRAGGALHVLNGNHELMNVALDLRYVTEAGYRDFADAADTSNPDSLLATYPPEQRGRVAALRPGGPYARLLAQRNTIMIVGDNLFVHGGVLPQHVDYGIEKINEEVRAWLRGETARPEVSAGSDSPIWTRVFSRDVDEATCAMAAAVLQRLNVRRMVMGHTVQEPGSRSFCDGTLWAIDVGMAAHYGGPIEVLEIRGNDVRVLRVPD